MTDNRDLGQTWPEEWAQAGRWPTSVRAIKKAYRFLHHFGPCTSVRAEQRPAQGGGWPRCAARASYLAVRARSRPQPPQTCLPARLPHSRTALWASLPHSAPHVPCSQESMPPPVTCPNASGQCSTPTCSATEASIWRWQEGLQVLQVLLRQEGQGGSSRQAPTCRRGAALPLPHPDLGPLSRLGRVDLGDLRRPLPQVSLARARARLRPLPCHPLAVLTASPRVLDALASCAQRARPHQAGGVGAAQ